MCSFIFCRVPFPLFPVSELVILLLEGKKWTFLFIAGTPCQLLNMLFNSASHSVRYYYPYFCRWGNWGAELWSNLFKVILLLNGRSGILTWVWLILKSLCDRFPNCFMKFKKKLLVIFFLLSVFVIILNHVIISL